MAGIDGEMDVKPKFEFIPDYARRCADIINDLRASHEFNELCNKWVAIRLSDGGSDKTLYDSKADAIRHQLHEQQCAYISFRNLMNGITAREAKVFLDFTRQAYDSGMRLVDPDDTHGGQDLFLANNQWDYLKRRESEHAVREILAEFLDN